MANYPMRASGRGPSGSQYANVRTGFSAATPSRRYQGVYNAYGVPTQVRSGPTAQPSRPQSPATPRQSGVSGVGQMQSNPVSRGQTARNGFGPMNGSAQMNRTMYRGGSGLFGGLGSLVKGAIGKDPMGTINKVVSIMKILG